jgi:hypothetical protein
MAAMWQVIFRRTRLAGGGVLIESEAAEGK